MGSYNPAWLEGIPPLRSQILFFDPNSNGARLTLVQKPCWKCLLLTKSVEVDDSVSYGLELFFSTNPHFLNDSIVEVSVNAVNYTKNSHSALFLIFVTFAVS